jgi:hypothetical protein
MSPSPPTAKWLRSTGKRTPATLKALATETEPPQVSGLPVAQIQWHRTTGNDTARALRRPDELAALVLGVLHAHPADELDWIEWKSSLDLRGRFVS